jgi:ectoine hydroxylase-related dioxygenase (phytanoyl-CoA dioxygenase family)
VATQTPPLSSNGILLETGPETIGELRDASSLLGDPEALRQRMADDGYLLLRGLIDRGTVLEARRELLLKYATVGEIDSINRPLMDGIQSEQTFVHSVNLIAFTESLRTGIAYRSVVEAPELISFFEDFLGGPARSWDFCWVRLMRPGEATGMHCDSPYATRGTKNVWSAWIPLGDLRREEGALMILEGSHKNEELRESYGNLDADRDKLGWLSTDPPALRRSLGGRWLTTDFRAGDVMVFSMYLVHGSLDNNSPEGRCRLTSDVRYQLLGDPLDERWNGDIANPHGGSQKVFLPGRPRGNDNKEFGDEWKEVDELGRLAEPVSAVPS